MVGSVEAGSALVSGQRRLGGHLVAPLAFRPWRLEPMRVLRMVIGADIGGDRVVATGGRGRRGTHGQARRPGRETTRGARMSPEAFRDRAGVSAQCILFPLFNNVIEMARGACSAMMKFHHLLKTGLGSARAAFCPQRSRRSRCARNQATTRQRRWPLHSRPITTARSTWSTAAWRGLLKKFPKRELRPQAELLQAQALYQLGRDDDAGRFYLAAG